MGTIGEHRILIGIKAGILQGIAHAFDLRAHPISADDLSGAATWDGISALPLPLFEGASMPFMAPALATIALHGLIWYGAERSVRARALQGQHVDPTLRRRLAGLDLAAVSIPAAFFLYGCVAQLWWGQGPGPWLAIAGGQAFIFLLLIMHWSALHGHRFAWPSTTA